MKVTPQERLRRIVKSELARVPLLSRIEVEHDPACWIHRKPHQRCNCQPEIRVFRRAYADQFAN